MRRPSVAAAVCLWLPLTGVPVVAQAPGAGPGARRVLSVALAQDMEQAVDPSPDGLHVAYVSDSHDGVSVREIASEAVRPMVAGRSGFENHAPVWSADGRHLAYSAQDGSLLGIIAGAESDPPLDCCVLQGLHEPAGRDRRP